MSFTQGNKYKEEDWVSPDAETQTEGVRSETETRQGTEESNTGDEDMQAEGKHGFLQFVKALNRKVVVFAAAGVGLILLVVLLIPKGDKSGEDTMPTPSPEGTYNVTQDDTVLGGFQYTVEELAELRVNGYTAEEVENYEALEIPAESLIMDAELKRKELYESELAPYLDAASDEYKELAADTWVGQTELQLSEDVAAYRFHMEVWNVDYKKLPPRGNQLFLKLTLDDGRVLFMVVTPEQYLRFSESGNIVVQVRYTSLGDGTQIITQITEKDIQE